MIYSTSTIPALFVSACFSLLWMALAHAEPMVATWYQSGHRTACGERFNANDPTIVAHHSLPCGTVLSITNPENGRNIRVTVQDRGPLSDHHLDLSRAAAVRLGFRAAGVTTLNVVVVNDLGEEK